MTLRAPKAMKTRAPEAFDEPLKRLAGGPAADQGVRPTSALVRSGFRLSADPLRTDDEPAGRGADETEGIAGYESHGLLPRLGREHFHGARRDHLRRYHPVTKFATLRSQHNYVVETDVSQRPEKGVAVAGKNYVSRLA
jgi:hypothetical protein